VLFHKKTFHQFFQNQQQCWIRNGGDKAKWLLGVENKVLLRKFANFLDNPLSIMK
jgi:hypothetical protein